MNANELRELITKLRDASVVVPDGTEQKYGELFDEAAEALWGLLDELARVSRESHPYRAPSPMGALYCRRRDGAMIRLPSRADPLICFAQLAINEKLMPQEQKIVADGFDGPHTRAALDRVFTKVGP